MTDDQGHGDLGIHGNPVIRTPNLDALARQGVQLSDFYVHPVCAPTRASLMTGRWCQRTSAIDTYRGRAMLEPQETTLAELLQAAGYATGIFGKWHLGDCHPVRAMDQGFETTLLHRGGGIGQPSDPPGGEGRYTDPILFRNGVAEQTDGYCTDVYVDEAIAWIRECVEEDKPFFAYVPTNAPHGPYHDVPADTYAHYKQLAMTNADFPQETGHPIARDIRPDLTAREYAMIENIDQAVGRLLASLEEAGVADNTIVIFMHDNGPQHLRYNSGFRSNKGSIYEGGIRSPFFIRWNDGFPGERRVDAVAAHVDLLPTLLDACELDQPEDIALDGTSLLPILRGEQDLPERTIVIQAHRGDVPVRWHNAMIRIGDWKLLNASGFTELKDGATPRMKLELYDLASDPFEQRDVAAEHPGRVESMKDAYDHWFEDVGAEHAANYDPPEISVGHPSEPRTVLTRQDWRGAGWGDRARGYWLVNVLEEGPYRVTVLPCRGDRWPEAEEIRLVVGCERLGEGLVPGSPQLVLENVRLPLGSTRIEAEVTDARGMIGAYQVILERSHGSRGSLD